MNGGTSHKKSNKEKENTLNMMAPEQNKSLYKWILVLIIIYVHV